MVGKLAAWLLLLACHAGAATYYVDYASGSDSAAGTSTGAPWKHSPGDSLATGSANIIPSNGDTIIFRGGVTYYGKVRQYASGITYLGDSWGTTNAILDGTVQAAPGMIQCDVSDPLVSGMNLTNLWKASITNGLTLDAFWVGETIYLPSVWPLSSERYIPNNALDSKAVPSPYTPSLGVGTYASKNCFLTDSSVFTSADVNYWTGSYVGIVDGNNIFNWYAVSNYFAATNTINYSGGTPSTSGTHYRMFNHMSFLTNAGYYYLDTNTTTLYVRSYPGDNLSNSTVRVNAQTYGFYSSSPQTNNTIRGFVIRGQKGEAIRFNNSGGGYGQGLVIRSNRFENADNLLNTAVIYLTFANASTIDHNTLLNCRGTRGIYANGHDLNINSNIVGTAGGSGIASFLSGLTPNSTNVNIIGNTVTNILSVHGNGITVYGDYSNYVGNVVIDRNRVIGADYPLTLQNITNLTLANNLFVATGLEGLCYIYRTALGTVRFLNNTWVDSSMSIGRGVDTNAYLANNIFSTMNLSTSPFNPATSAPVDDDSIELTNRQNNIYYVAPTFGTLRASEFLTNNVMNATYQPQNAATNGGVNLTGLGFSISLDGQTRGSSWDIGAYQYSTNSSGGGENEPVAPSTNRVRNMRTLRVGTMRTL